MRIRHGLARFAKPLVPVLLAAASLGGVLPVLTFAQGNAPAQLPDSPAKPGFDITRFAPNGGIFKTFSVEQTEPLQKVLQDGRVTDDWQCL